MNDQKLSEHFWVHECEFSDTAARKGIPNELPQSYLPYAKAIAENVLEPIREHFGQPYAPTSWYRGPMLNKEIGGARNSQHTKAQACDLKIPGVKTYRLAEWIMENLDFDQLILERWNPDKPSSGWVHVSYVANGTNRNQVLTFDGKDYTKGLPL